MYWGDYKPRPSVGELRIQAAKKVKELKGDGLNPQPVLPIEGRGKIAKSFWGHSWCVHLENHCDFENRLPRGRTYVRNGAVVHLEVNKGEVIAFVLGSELYELSIEFEPLRQEEWKAICEDCRGQVGSLLELLQGRLSDAVMGRVTDPAKGLFPQVGEMHFGCNCPDWADMCKHVAAALYGVGVRLDEEPELLFKLRGVDQRELIDSQGATDAVLRGRRVGQRKTLAISSIKDVFGIEPEGLEALEEMFASEMTGGSDSTSAEEVERFTGNRLKAGREKICLNPASFAKMMGASQAQQLKWEASGEGEIKLSQKQKKLLRTIEDDSE